MRREEFEGLAADAIGTEGDETVRAEWQRPVR
jgi:hypothetical protein